MCWLRLGIHFNFVIIVKIVLFIIPIYRLHHIYFLVRDICLIETHRFTEIIIKTTRWTRGMHLPFKGIIPACAWRHTEKSGNRISFTAATQVAVSFAYWFLLPVNGSIYSFSVIWSFAISSVSWFRMYSSIAFCSFLLYLCNILAPEMPIPILVFQICMPIKYHQWALSF